jgi:putative thioredoxin
LAKVNVQDHPNLAAYFRINAIPDVKVISERRLLTEFQGLLPEEQLRQLLDQLVGPMADPEVVNAMAAEESSPARAEQLYREKVAAEPDQLDARVGLARVLLLQGKLDEIASILEPVGASGDLGAESEAILARAWLMTNAKDITAPATPNDAKGFLDHGACLAAKGELEQALPALLRAAELDFKLATGKVREVMVKVFYALGTSHPLANEYRSKLSRLLY